MKTTSLTIRILVILLVWGLPLISTAQSYVDSLQARIIRGDYGLCLEGIDSYLADNKDDLNALYNRGIVNYYFQELDAGYVDFQRIIAIDAGNYDANLMISKYYIDKQLPDRAIQYLNFLSELYPDSAKPYDTKIDLYWDKGQWEQMAWESTQMIRLAPENSTYYFYKAFAYYSNGQFLQSRSLLDKAINMDESVCGYYWTRALVLSENPDQSKNDLKQALSDITTAIELMPEKYKIYGDRATILRKSGDCDNAVADLKTVIEKGTPGLNTWFDLGVCYYQMKNFDEARQSFNEVLKINETHSLANHYIALIDNNNTVNITPGDAQLLENYLPGWKSDLSSVPELLEAFNERDNVTIFATKPTQTYGSINNQISSFWNFTYKGVSYTAYHHDLFAKAASTDNNTAFRYLNYSVYKNDEEMVCDISMLLEGDNTSEIILVPEDGRLKATGVLKGNTVNYKSEVLEAPYNYTNKAMMNAKNGDEIPYSMFDIWALKVTLVKSELKLEDGNMAVYSFDENGNMSKTVYNQKCERIYSESSGSESVSMEVDQAYLERGQAPSVFDNTVSLDYWLNHSEDMDEMKVRVIFYGEIQDNLFQNKRLTVVRDSVNPNVAILTIRKENPKPNFGEKLAENPALLTDIFMEPTLKSNYLIESDNQEIKELALKLTATVDDTIQKAMVIASWVEKNIKGTYEYASQSALETLHNLKGDCSEKSVMFAALCRSIGIPTREVRGYSLSVTTAGGHAWDAIFVNGAWVEIDPTIGNFAGAGHLELNSFVGNGIKSVQIISYTSENKEMTVDKFTPYWKIENKTYKNRIWNIEIPLPKKVELAYDKYLHEYGFNSLPGFSLKNDKGVDQGILYFAVYDNLSDPESYASDNVFLGTSYSDFRTVEIAGFKGLCYKTTEENLTYQCYEMELQPGNVIKIDYYPNDDTNLQQLDEKWMSKLLKSIKLVG